MSKKQKCSWKNCPIRFGFEMFYQGEDDEEKARKHILPTIREFFKSGSAVMRAYDKVVKPKKKGK